MAYIADFDEIHAMAEAIIEEYEVPADAVQAVKDYLISVYMDGRRKCLHDLYTDIEEDEDMWMYLMPMIHIEDVVEKEIAGKTMSERVLEYVQQKDVESLARVIDTESHRDHETGAYEMAEQYQSVTGTRVYKVWHTMLDDRVRDTHDYLEGAMVPMHARFYTYDNDSARFPGDFSKASNNVACRCILTYKKSI